MTRLGENLFREEEDTSNHRHNRHVRATQAIVKHWTKSVEGYGHKLYMDNFLFLS